MEKIDEKTIILSDEVQTQEDKNQVEQTILVEKFFEKTKKQEQNGYYSLEQYFSTTPQALEARAQLRKMSQEIYSEEDWKLLILTEGMSSERLVSKRLGIQKMTASTVELSSKMNDICIGFDISQEDNIFEKYQIPIEYVAINQNWQDKVFRQKAKSLWDIAVQNSASGKKIIFECITRFKRIYKLQTFAQQMCECKSFYVPDYDGTETIKKDKTPVVMNLSDVEPVYVEKYFLDQFLTWKNSKPAELEGKTREEQVTIARAIRAKYLEDSKFTYTPTSLF